MKLGAVITTPNAFTTGDLFFDTPAFVGQVGWLAIDNAGPGTSFVVGSDMPVDVPCTQACP